MSTAMIQAPAAFRTATAQPRSVQRRPVQRRPVQRRSVTSPAVTSGPGNTTHLRLTRRGRNVLVGLVSIPLVAGALMFALNAENSAAAAGAGNHASFEYVTVQSGQSLWSIAEKVAPNADPRDVIASIVSLNQITSGVVSPGERLAIPAQYESTGR